MKRSTKERLLGLLIIIPVLILLTLSLSNCSVQSQEQKEIKLEKAILNNPDAAVRYDLPPETFAVANHIAYVIRIDGCQYIIIPGYHEYSIVHKGNCYNSIHYDTPKPIQ